MNHFYFSRYSRWDAVISLLTMANTHPEAARYAFDAALVLVPETPDIVLTPQNFGECVDLLISFSTAAGVIYSSTNINSSSGLSNNSIARTSSGVDDKSGSASPKPMVTSVNGRRVLEGSKESHRVSSQKKYDGGFQMSQGV